MWFFNKCHTSQADRLLEFFKNHKGEEIALPRILDIRPRLAHHTEVIRQLREKGYKIECREWWEKHSHCSAYTFIGIELLPRVKEKKKKYTEEEVEAIRNESYEKGYESARIQFTK